MAKVFRGSDGSFVTAWQIWKRRNHSPETFVLASGDTVVFRPSGGQSGEYLWYHGVDEEELPEGVSVNGVTVRDRRGDDSP